MGNRVLKQMLVFGLIVCLMCLTGLLPVRAESSFLTSRVNQIESRLRNLSSQFNQLQSQVNRLSGCTGTVTQQPVPTATAGTPSLEVQFDNLAILAIELRDRIIELEERVSALEGDSS